jgi:hypothetical protein
MIYELRTTRVRPGGVPEFESRLEHALPGREQLSKLAGSWHTDIGPLMQVIELWPYEDRNHHREVAQALRRNGGWPTVDGDLVLSVESELLEPAPFMRPLDCSPQQVGPMYELRTYQIKPGSWLELINRWAPMVPGREQLSPLLGLWHSEMSHFIHLWPYHDLTQRTRIRDEARRQGIWPPNSTEFLLTQESKIMLPASFSPLQ